MIVFDKVLTKKHLLLAALFVCVLFGGKLAYKVYLFWQVGICMEDSPDVSFRVYNDRVSETIDLTFPLAYIWPGNATSPLNTKTTVVGVSFDLETLRPNCVRREEWLHERLYPGWDPRFVRLSINKRIKAVPNRGSWQRDEYTIPTGKDKFGYQTYVQNLTAEYKNKYGYRQLYIIPSGMLSNEEAYVSCYIIAPGRENYPEWRGKPSRCDFYTQYKEANIKVDFQYEQMNNLPEVKRKAEQFIDTYMVDNVGEKLWHFLTR